MSDRRKILLGTKDVVPKKNEDIFLNVELSSSSDELLKEIIDNNFNLLEQFNKERQNSLRFCVYGTIDSKQSDMENIALNIKTNHNDLLYSPKKTSNTVGRLEENVKTKNLSKGGILSKNIFNKKKSSYYYLFEISNDFNNPGETKELILSMKKPSDNIANVENVPFIHYDSDGERIEFGTETIDIDLGGNIQTIENDYPFLYEIHWIRRDMNPPRPERASFMDIPNSKSNILTIEENDGIASFYVGLEAPSTTGLESLSVVVSNDETIRNPNEDFIFERTDLKWEVGQRFKRVEVGLVDDLYVEDTELITFGFENLVFVEEGLHNSFILKLEDKDKPTPVGFEIINQEFIESAFTLTIKVVLDSPIPVPDQEVIVVFNNSLTTAVIGEDFENTGTLESPEFSKKIKFAKGTTSQTFTIELYDDFKYELDKNLVLDLVNPTQNLEISPQFGTHTITLKDSMVTQYTRYTISGDSQAGTGIFRMSGEIEDDETNLEWANSSNQFGFTNLFTHTISVINNGEPVVIGDRIVDKFGLVYTIDMTDGYEGLSIDLPSNFSLDAPNHMFTKSMYTFIIENIEAPPGPIAGVLSSFGNNQNEENARRFDRVSTDSEVLDASSSGSTEYFMVSKVSNLKTRLNTNNSPPTCANIITTSAIDVEINGALLLSRLMTHGSTGGSPFSSPNQGTELKSIKFKSEPAAHYTCENEEDENFVPYTSLLPFKFPADFNF